MEKDFKNHLKTNFPYLGTSRVLLAVSGGLDSIVLAHLCTKAKLNFAIAHCNFNLRGEESDADENFVLDLADALEVEIFTESFDTLKYAATHKISTQMAARNLRYNWFRHLSATLNFDYTLTAHHANDNLETFLINLVRGSGLEGFTGIREENKQLLRPLLPFSRRQIREYADENSIAWREDSSNASNKYLRNKIRHKIVPVLEEINPQFLGNFAQTQLHLNDSLQLVEDYISLVYPEIVSKNKFGYELNISALEKIPNTRAVLYELLKSFKFTQWNDIYDLLSAQPGKRIFSETHRLVKDREVLILTEKYQDPTHTEYYIPEGEEVVMLPPGKFYLTEVLKITDTSEHIIYVNADKLEFPLTLRKWKKGDFFYPFGMKGKKKVSDFFKDKKFSLPEKENCWILLSGKEIAWIVNYRADNRFAITDPSQKILKISYFE